MSTEISVSAIEEPLKGSRLIIVSVTGLAERFMSDHSTVRNKAKSNKENRRLLDKHILPSLGKMKVESIRREDVEKLHHAMRDTPYQANRVIALISKMFNLAEKWNMRPEGSNPTRHIEKYKERARERYLSELEIDRLGKSLIKCESDGTISSHFAAAIRLLILTGCRASEIRTLRWEHVDFERSALRLPDSKTGAKVVVLNTPAIEVLSSIKRFDENPHVIVGLKPGASLTDFEKPWQRLRKDAELEDVRLHDLRHSFAGFAASAGVSAPIVGRLLGHKTLQATERYAHIAEDPARLASEGVGLLLAASLKGASTVDEHGKEQTESQ
jgi:integrase